MTLSVVVTQGDRRRSLEALRDRLAAELEGSPPQYVAGLARQLQSCLAELDGLGVERGGSVVDDLSAARAARRSAAASSS